MCTIPYFAYLDSTGEAHKAFVLPQEDPTFYDRFTDTYNVVELVKPRVNIDPFELARAMQRPAVDAVFPNPPVVDAYTGAICKAIEAVPSGGRYRRAHPAAKHGRANNAVSDVDTHAFYLRAGKMAITSISHSHSGRQTSAWTTELGIAPGKPRWRHTESKISRYSGRFR